MAGIGCLGSPAAARIRSACRGASPMPLRTRAQVERAPGKPPARLLHTRWLWSCCLDCRWTQKVTPDLWYVDFVGIPVGQLVQILPASIAPVIVISGVGLLLLSMTNRSGRAIDRARDLVKDLEASLDEPRRRLVTGQIPTIYRRARSLRTAISLRSLRILCVVVTVLALFAGLVAGVTADYVAVPCFGLSLILLLGSLYFFIRDIMYSLTALELEVGPYK